MINSLFIALVRYRALQATQRERESSQYFLLEESWEGVLILAKSMYGERESGKKGDERQSASGSLRFKRKIELSKWRNLEILSYARW